MTPIRSSHAPIWDAPCSMDGRSISMTQYPMGTKFCASRLEYSAAS
jgi:hypothetical protein